MTRPRAKSVWRAAALAAALPLVVGCGSPEVELPPGNEQTTSAAPSDLPAPSLPNVPASYPYARLPLRGQAGKGASRVFVEGAGNPVVADVQLVDGSFCVMVELLASPARYTLEVRTQASDGKVSASTTVEVERDNSAPAPTNATLCDGTPAS